MFALMTTGTGNRAGMYAEIFVSLIYNLLLFNFLIFLFLENVFLPTTFIHTHDPHPHPGPTTSTHYPRPTTFSYTQSLLSAQF